MYPFGELCPLFRDLDRAGRWLLTSGIQDTSGGVARYYRSDLERNAPVSAEITGYALSAFLCLHHLDGAPEYMEAAVRAARFLTRSAWDAAATAFPFELSSGLAYFFDTGIIVRGLMRLWRETHDPEPLETARASARAMAADFAAGGVFHPVLKLPSKQPLPYDHRWSMEPGCYQLKAALGWLELDSAGPYEKVLDYSLAGEAAFLPGDPDRERVMDRLHAYSYFLEGLLPRAERPECARALARGIGRVATHLREIAPVFARSDVYAQLLRVRLYADRLGVLRLDRAAAEEEAAAIAAFQCDAADPRMNGGFWFGRKRGEFLPYVNPVSTAFCVQALALWQTYKEGRFDPDWRALI
jgi:hypothetical protein